MDSKNQTPNPKPQTPNPKPQTLRERINRKPWIGWLLFLATVVVVFFLGLLASSIMERRAEAVFAYTPQVKFETWEPRNEVWGENFPREYQSYLEMRDTAFRSKYNGSVMIDMLERHPEMVVLWAGYGFSKEYTQGRGHYYSIEDIRATLRTGAPVGEQTSPMPNTCWSCKSTDVPRVMSDIGPAEFYKGSWETRGHQITNPIGCTYCHDPATMNLQIKQPALLEALERRGFDIGEASHQQMRSLVCAQCHVEYYFDNRGEKVNYLTFPWDNGMNAEDMERYYDDIEFYDWIHPISRAPMIKAQHPGYESYLKGIHADRGVSCADCHMPYISEGGVKFTSHHLQSPLNNVENSCTVCHREETLTLVKNVYERQDAIIENRVKLEKMLVRAHVEASLAWELGATEEEMAPVLTDIRHAQWRWDYAAASHGASFHAPVEIGRVVSTALVITQEARLELSRILARKGHLEPVPYPDIATKARAQEFVGWNMKKLKQEKEEFLNTVVPQWEKIAKEREEGYPVQRIETL